MVGPNGVTVKRDDVMQYVNILNAMTQRSTTPTINRDENSWHFCALFASRELVKSKKFTEKTFVDYMVLPVRPQ